MQIQNQQIISEYRHINVPQINYQEAINYEQRPSPSIHSQRPQVFPAQIPIPATYVKSHQALSNTLPQSQLPNGLNYNEAMFQTTQLRTNPFHQFDKYSSNGYETHGFSPNHNHNKLPLNPENDYKATNFKFQLEELKFKPNTYESNLPSYNSSQTASFGQITPRK